MCAMCKYVCANVFEWVCDVLTGRSSVVFFV